MTKDQKKNLETQLWGIANLLHNKISVDQISLGITLNYTWKR